MQQDRLIFKRKLLLMAAFACAALLVIEGTMLFLLQTVPAESRFTLVIAMVVCAVTVIPCMLFLMYYDHLRVNERTVASYKLTKLKAELRWEDVTMTVETRAVNNKSGASSVSVNTGAPAAKFIVMKNSYDNEIAFVYDPKTYAILSSYLSAAHPDDTPADLNI